MKIYKILFLVGKDRPGIVDDVSTLLLKCNANIEDSHMCVMGGCFSIMALFSCSCSDLETVQSGMQDLEIMGFEASLHEATTPVREFTGVVRPLSLEIQAMDHPGIVQQVVHLLREFDVNILSLDTKVSNAPLSGAPLFSLRLDAHVPENRSVDTIKTALNHLAAREDLDLLISPE